MVELFLVLFHERHGGGPGCRGKGGRGEDHRRRSAGCHVTGPTTLVSFQFASTLLLDCRTTTGWGPFPQASNFVSDARDRAWGWVPGTVPTRVFVLYFRCLLQHQGRRTAVVKVRSLWLMCCSSPRAIAQGDVRVEGRVHRACGNSISSSSLSLDAIVRTLSSAWPRSSSLPGLDERPDAPGVLRLPDALRTVVHEGIGRWPMQEPVQPRRPRYERFRSWTTGSPVEQLAWTMTGQLQATATLADLLVMW